MSLNFSLQRLEAVKGAMLALSTATTDNALKFQANELLTKITPNEMIDICENLFRVTIGVGDKDVILSMAILNYWLYSIVKIDKIEKIKQLHKSIDELILKNEIIFRFFLESSFLVAKLQQLLAYILCLIRPKESEAFDSLVTSYFGTRQGPLDASVASFVLGVLYEICDQLIVTPDSRNRATCALNRLSNNLRSFVVDDLLVYMESVFKKLDELLALRIIGMYELLPSLEAKLIAVLCNNNKLKKLPTSCPSFDFRIFKESTFYDQRLAINTCRCYTTIIETLCRVKSRKGNLACYEYYALPNYKSNFAEFIRNIITVVSFVIFNSNLDNFERADTLHLLLLSLQLLINASSCEVWYDTIPSILSILCYSLNHPYLEFPALSIDIFRSLISKISNSAKHETKIIWEDANISQILLSIMCRLIRSTDYHYKQIDDLLLQHSKHLMTKIGLSNTSFGEGSWGTLVKLYVQEVSNDKCFSETIRHSQIRINNGYTEILGLIGRKESSEVCQRAIQCSNDFLRTIESKFNLDELVEAQRNIPPEDCPLMLYYQLIYTIVQSCSRVPQLISCLNYKANSGTSNSLPEKATVNSKMFRKYAIELVMIQLTKKISAFDNVLTDVTDDKDIVALCASKLDNKTFLLENKRLDSLRNICNLIRVGEDDELAVQARQFVAAFLLKRLFLFDISKIPQSDLKLTNLNVTPANIESTQRLARTSGDILKLIFISDTPVCKLEDAHVETRGFLDLLLRRVGNTVSNCNLYSSLVISLISSVGTYDVICQSISSCLNPLIEKHAVLLMQLTSVEALSAFIMSKDTNKNDLIEQFICLENMLTYISIPEDLTYVQKLGFTELIKTDKLDNNNVKKIGNEKLEVRCNFKFKHPLKDFLTNYLPLILRFIILLYGFLSNTSTMPEVIQKALNLPSEEAIYGTASRMKINSTEITNSLRNCSTYEVVMRGSETYSIVSFIRSLVQKSTIFTSSVIKLSVMIASCNIDLLKEFAVHISQIVCHDNVPFFSKDYLVRNIVREGLLVHLEQINRNLHRENNQSILNCHNESLYIPNYDYIEFGVKVADLYVDIIHNPLIISTMNAYLKTMSLPTNEPSSANLQSVLKKLAENDLNNYIILVIYCAQRIVQLPSSLNANLRSFTPSSLQTSSLSRCYYQFYIIKQMYETRRDLPVDNASLVIESVLNLARIPVLTCVNNLSKCIQHYVRTMQRRIVPVIYKYNEVDAIYYLQKLQHLFELIITIVFFNHDILISTQKQLDCDLSVLQQVPVSVNKLDIEKFNIYRHYITTGRPEYFNIVKGSHSKELLPGCMPMLFVNVIVEIFKAMNNIFSHFVHLKHNREFLSKDIFMQEVSNYPPYKQTLLFFDRKDLNFPYTIPTARLVSMTKNLGYDNDTEVHQLCVEFVHENIKYLLIN